jgi:hypothetical protein
MLAGAALPLAGCTALSTHKTAKRDAAAPPPSVKVSGQGFRLGESQQSALAPADFLRRVQNLLVAGQQARARRLIERFPDVALETLRQSTSASSGDAALQLIAEVYDARYTRNGGSAGWLALVQDRQRQPAHYTAHEAARKELLEHVRHGRSKEAAGVKLWEALSKQTLPVVRLDAAQLRAEALLGADQPAAAVKVLQAALTEESRGFAHQSSALLLLLSEAHRRCGHEPQAIAAWEQSVERAGEVTLETERVSDPVHWERVSSLRPVKTAWPKAVAARLQGKEGGEGEFQTVSAKTTTASETDEAVLWLGIGQSRLARGEAQAALMAFKRAEVWNRNPAWQEQVQVQEARALIEMNQTAPATALLVPLATRGAAAVKSPALALLGAVKFKAGQVHQSLTLLRRAVEQEGAEWPGRADAEADLGLAYLAAGKETDGLKWLRSARGRYESAGAAASVVQCLENEAAYLEHKGKPDEGQLLRAQAKELAGS